MVVEMQDRGRRYQIGSKRIDLGAAQQQMATDRSKREKTIDLIELSLVCESEKRCGYNTVERMEEVRTTNRLEVVVG